MGACMCGVRWKFEYPGYACLDVFTGVTAMIPIIGGGATNGVGLGAATFAGPTYATVTK
jgi:hypothetical protein